MQDFRVNLSDSAADFRNTVWPNWSRHFGGGELHSVEEGAERSPVLQMLDRFGVDGFVFTGQFGAPIGIASRVEYVAHEPRFTLRVAYRDRLSRDWIPACEFQKKATALGTPATAGSVPYYTIQSYVSERRIGRCLHTSRIVTADLIRFAGENFASLAAKTYWDTRYVIVPINALEEAGVDVMHMEFTGSRLSA